MDAELVVVEASIRYRAPVLRDIICSCGSDDREAGGFIERLTKKGRSRITPTVAIGDNQAAGIGATMHGKLLPNAPR